ncbi:hypothetical protein [Persicobacter psychrovividus]|uniref:Uncharacterized protein n=1 Tax=Persicobacter psychrovividus TaxID=387638 RepID=A0ABM7VCZ0_9BACT|nr:hypothetical protein PEPS_10490 [Persicobacter psychrovividus]
MKSILSFAVFLLFMYLGTRDGASVAKESSSIQNVNTTICKAADNPTVKVEKVVLKEKTEKDAKACLHKID